MQQQDKDNGAREVALPVVSLFSGVGGLDLGFEAAGFTVDLAIELTASGVNTYNANRPVPVAHTGNLHTLTLADLDKLAGHPIRPVGIIGGPPCQYFSQGNTVRKPNDVRRKGLFAFVRIVRDLNDRHPVAFFVFENVPKLASGASARRFARFVQLMESIGFSVTHTVLDAHNFGLPQRRKRLFVVGFNRRLIQEHAWTPPVSKSRKKLLRDKLLGMPEPVYNSEYRMGVRSNYHPNHVCMTPKSPKFSKNARPVKEALQRSFKRLKWDLPSPTVAYGNREVHVHPNGDRRLSVLEAALIQGFTRKFVFQGCMSDQFKQISEAVPPPVARAVALSIRRHLRRAV